MKEKKIKTNALRILDKQKIEYEIHTYEWSEGTSSGLGVAEKLPELADRIFKTIVLKGKTKNLHVCVIPGAAHLDLKKVAKACGEKNIELLPLSELEKNTGYIRGGCSPVGMKKKYDTFFDESALKFEKRSAGNSDFEDKEKNSKGSDRKIDAFFALHMAPEIPTGKIGVKVGKAHACSAQLKATIHGVSAHAALPHKGVDAILIGAKVLEFFQSIVSRRIDPREGAVITIGSFKGGETNNIVCDKVEMLGTIRTLSNETRLFIKETIERDLPIFVESLGGKAEVSIRLGYAPVINNEEMTNFVAKNIVDLFGKDALETIKEARMDVEDVSYFLNEIPGCFFRLGTRNEAKDMIYDLHHPKFNVDEEAIKYGIGLQLKNILEYLNK